MKDVILRSYELAPRVNITGEKIVIEEKIKKEHQQVNVLTQTIVRRSVRHVVFDCGHTIQKRFDTPKNSTTCYECGKALAEKER